MIAQTDSSYFQTRPTATLRRLIARTIFEGRPITTRHRWINHLVFSHMSLTKHLPAMQKVDRPVFIVGAGRSGSTLLGILLSIHKQVGMLSEPKAMWHSIYPQEDVIGHYSQGKANYNLSENDAEQIVIKNAHRLFAAFQLVTMSKRVVDKNPELVFRIPFVQTIFPEAKFLFLVRNGWNTVYSISKWSEREGIIINGVREDWWGVNDRKWNLIVEQLVPNEPTLAPYTEEIASFRDHQNRAAVEWIVTMRAGLKQLEKVPESMYLLRYDDLMESPTDTLMKLQDFCGLEHDPKFLRYAEQRIKPIAPHPPLEIASFLQHPFSEIQQKLGYGE